MWFAVRNIYYYGRRNDGMNVYEERVVAFKAASAEEAHEFGTSEAMIYKRAGGYLACPEQLVFRLDEGTLVHGHEVWSELLQTEQEPAEFYESRYENYRYVPEAEKGVWA
jgi:hypothetical protein